MGHKINEAGKAELRDSFLKTVSKKNEGKNLGNEDVMKTVNSSIDSQPIGQTEGPSGGQGRKQISWPG